MECILALWGKVLNMEYNFHILSVSNLSVTAREMKILDNINFKLEAGKALAVVGPNGSGKTTLFRALMKLIPYTGTVEWGESIRMGYVPQTLITTDIPISVEEFLLLRGHVDPVSALEVVGLERELLMHPLGKLSGGQLQRVLLAWAISNNPNVLLFDEPTSLVDIGSEEPIHNMVRDVRNRLGTTVLLITHNVHIVSHYSDYVLALNRTQTHFGPTSELTHERLISLMSGVGEL